MKADLAASVRARLLNRAKERREDFSLALSRYAVERFLYRLSLTPWRERFLLKGALLFELWFDEPHRPTRDADFLGLGPEDAKLLKGAVREICEVLPAPRLRVYPRETVVAEKLEAIVSLGIANSRMKDFFDIRALIREGELECDNLALAIAATMARRGTPVPDGLPLGLSDEFATDPVKLGQWRAFLGKNRLVAPGLRETIVEIRDYLREPIRVARRRGVPA